MRDREATETEIRAAGHLIGEERSKSAGRMISLQGSGDANAATDHDQKLETMPGNPNHVHVTGWPSKDDKAKQKLIALQIAKVAKFVPVKEPLLPAAGAAEAGLLALLLACSLH